MTLPKLLSQPDYNNRAGSERALADEATNDLLALRLGHAFLQGRLHQFLNLTVHVEPGSAPPYPTQEECDLYAGGYQYSFDSTMHDELSGEVGEAEQVEHVTQIMARLRAIEKERTESGLTLELVDERMTLRDIINGYTLGNLVNKVNNMEPLEVAMRKASTLFNERRPYETGKPKDGFLDELDEQVREAGLTPPKIND